MPYRRLDEILMSRYDYQRATGQGLPDTIDRRTVHDLGIHGIRARRRDDSRLDFGRNIRSLASIHDVQRHKRLSRMMEGHYRTRITGSIKNLP